MSDVLACFPMKSEWEALYTTPAEPFPAPVVSSREPHTEVPPKPLLSLAGFAREQSWEVRMQYSLGYVPHSRTGVPSPLKEMFALRFGLHPMTERMAYAVYSRPESGGTWAWSSVMIWGPDLPPFGGCGISELKAYLMYPALSTEGMRAFVQDVKAIRENGETLAKGRALARKVIFRMLDQGEPREKIQEHVSAFYTAEEVQKIIAGRKTVLKEGRR